VLEGANRLRSSSTRCRNIISTIWSIHFSAAQPSGSPAHPRAKKGFKPPNRHKAGRSPARRAQAVIVTFIHRQRDPSAAQPVTGTPPVLAGWREGAHPSTLPESFLSYVDAAKPADAFGTTSSRCWTAQGNHHYVRRPLHDPVMSLSWFPSRLVDEVFLLTLFPFALLRGSAAELGIGLGFRGCSERSERTASILRAYRVAQTGTAHL
jgi:hypothetical protein